MSFLRDRVLELLQSPEQLEKMTEKTAALAIDKELPKMDSVFTKIIKGKLPAFPIWESDLSIAILDINPINPGHTLLIPKQQVDYLFDLSGELYNHMWQSVKWLAPLIQQAMQCERIGIAVEGFSVPHVHIHLVPVNSGNELNPERAISASPEQLTLVQNKIHQAIENSL